jgi:hypothetical protein
MMNIRDYAAFSRNGQRWRRKRRIPESAENAPEQQDTAPWRVNRIDGAHYTCNPFAGFQPGDLAATQQLHALKKNRD